MSGTGLNSRISSGLRILDNTNLVSAYVTGKGLIGKGDNVNLEGFKEARIEEISNKNGRLEVNKIECVQPLSSTTEDGTAAIELVYNEEDFELSAESGISLKEKRAARFPLWIEKEDNVAYIELKHAQPLGTSEQGLTLFTDDSLQIKDGYLSVEQDTYEIPLVKDDHVVRLKFKEPLLVEDDQLTVDTKEIAKGAGAIRVYTANDIGGIGPDMPDFLDIDLPGDLEDYLQNGMLVKLQVDSNDFQQTGGRLALRSHGLYRIPFHSGLSGFDSDANFTYNNTLNILSAPTIHSNVDYNITEPTQVPTAAYLHQLMQSEAGSAVDIGAVANGRKLIKVNHDNSLSIDETNRLCVNVSNLVDGTSVKAVNNKLSVDPYMAGESISIIDNVISSKLTYSGSLRREGDQVIGKTVISGSSNVTVVQTNPFSYEVSVVNPQSQIDNLDDKVDDLNEKTDTEINALKNEDNRLDNKIDAVESRVQQQETKSDLFESGINTNRSNITALDNAKNQIQGDLISLAADVTWLTGVVDTVNTVATGVQVAQAVMKADVGSLQATALSLGAQLTGLDSVVTAYTSLPVVRNIIGVGGLLVTSDPISGTTVITATNPMMAKSKGTAPIDPILKSDDSILKDNGGGTDIGETAPPVDPPILPPNPPPPPPGGDTLRSTGRTDGNNGPCLDPIPPIWKGKDHTNQESWFREGWGVVWSRLPTIEVDGVPRTVLEYDENNLPIVPHGHIDIIHRRTDEEDFSSVLLTHDRHLQSGYLGVYHESMLQVPNLAMLYETWDSFMRPYVESCNYLNVVGNGLTKTNNTLSLSFDHTSFAKTSDLQSLTTKSYVDGLSYLTAGTGITKTGSTLSVNSSGITSVGTLTGLTSSGVVAISNATAAINTISLGSDLSAFEVKSNLKVLAYKDKVDYATDVINAPASVTYGSGLLFSNNTVSLNPAVSVDSVTTTGNISFAGSFNGTMNVNGSYLHSLVNSSTGSNSRTTLQIRAGGGTGLYINVNAQARTAFGGGNTATLMNYNGALRVLSQREKGIVIDEHGAIDVSERLSVGTTSDVVAFPPLSMTSNSTIISNQAYGNGTYVASTSSIFSSTYQPYAVFAAGGGWYSEATSGYDVTTGLYAGSQTTIVNSTNIAGEWVQIQMPVGIFLTSFDISGSSTYIRNVRDFTLVGSNDGSTFIHVLSSTISSWINGQTQTVNVPTPTTTKTFKIYRLIIRSINGLNSAYCYVGRLVFNGTPVSMEVKGAVEAKQVIADELVCNKISGDLLIDNDVAFKDDIVDPIKYPQIQLTGVTTQGYIANASSNLNGTSAGWKAFSNELGINDSFWSSSTYSGGEQNMYQGTVITVVDGSNIKGEWVELEMPEAIAISAFSFAARTPEMPMFPKNYTICGSDDRSNWTEISSGTMTYTIYQNSTSVDRYVPINNYILKKFKVFRFIVRNLISSTYAHIGKLTFYGSNATQKIIEAPAAKVNGLSLSTPSFGMFQLHSSQSFSVNGTAYQLITKWTPLFGMESDTITCSTNSQDIVIKLPGIYKVEFDLDVFQSGSGSVNSYFGFMVPGSTVYYEDGYHVRKHSMVAGQRVTGSSICRVVEADTKMILRFTSASSSGGITGSSASRLIIYRTAPL